VYDDWTLVKGVLMNGLRDWFRGWAETLRIMLFDRRLYRELPESIDAPIEDFVEAPRP
jgi:hypothetical protein